MIAGEVTSKVFHPRAAEHLRKHIEKLPDEKAKSEK
jgi:hypothetical protein